MDKRIVIATHGEFSKGIHSSVQMIFGSASPIECITAYVDPDIDYPSLFRRTVADHDYRKAELIVLTDVLGGSVNNEFIRLLDEYPFHLITGLNLPCLLELVTCPGDELARRLPEILNQSREGIALCNDLVSGAQAKMVDDDF